MLFKVLIEMKSWSCSVCGYVHVGDMPPEKCPKCGAPREKFVEQIHEINADGIIHMHYGQKVVYGDQVQVNPFFENGQFERAKFKI